MESSQLTKIWRDLDSTQLNHLPDKKNAESVETQSFHHVSPQRTLAKHRRDVALELWHNFKLFSGWNRQWKLNSDGASRGNPGPSGGGGVLRNSEGALYFGVGVGSHFLAELRALLVGIRISKKMGLIPHVVELDSRLLICSTIGPWKSSYWWDEFLLWHLPSYGHSHL